MLKKQKKLAIAYSLIIVVLALLLISLMAVCYASEAEEKNSDGTEQIKEETKSAWEVYVDEKLVPNIVLVLTAIGSIFIAISPILSKIRKASDKFKNATDDVNAVTSESGENKKKVANLSLRLDNIEKSVLNTEQMTRLGFCNLDEIVIKGYASEIAKVGKNEETTQPES